MPTDAKTIRAHRFVKIGAILQRDAGVIIDRWSQRAVEDQPHSRRVHREVLLDHLPTFLFELGRGLAESSDPFQCPHRRTALQHGEQRWEEGWSLDELIRDYQILRMVVLEYLDETLERPLRVREVMAVGLALDEAIEMSVGRYTAHCNEQFRRQTEGLRTADRRKNEFLATLAHELRNPLAPLRNCLDVMRHNESDLGGIRQAREIMERQVEQMTRLVDDMLDMSRIAEGKLELRKEPLDLRIVLNEAAQATRSFAEARQHEFSLSLPSEAIWVEGDQTRLVQIFVNLLNNAVKYTPPGGRLSLAALVEGPDIVVRVCDSGIGIPSGMLTQIFDLYTQIDLGSDRSPEGLGIGLSLVRRLVELHGGRIAAHSDGPQKGSEFTVALPRVAARPDVPADTGVAAQAAPAPTCRILLIEDNADARKSLALLLKLIGHHVIAAENGKRGVEAAKADCPDLALIDIGLPDLDGYDVARQLRSALGNRVLLVALTGFSQPEDRQRALEAGFDTHLTKPVELRTLQRLLATEVRR